MTLRDVWETLDVEMAVLAGHIRDFAADKSRLSSASDFSTLDECQLEGVLSRVWQGWSIFWRRSVIQSCLGTFDASGSPIVRLAEALDENHVSGAAIKARQKKKPYWGFPNEVLKREPTWGDVDQVANILERLRPENSSQLLAALSSANLHAKPLQVIRNAAAHNHYQNVEELLRLQSAYLVFPITHPTHAMFWIEPRSREFLILNIIEELTATSLAAVGSPPGYSAA